MRRRGFTLIELMVVIGIIVLLASILLPVVSQVRQTAYNTTTAAQMQRIMQACQQYYHDFNSYPGPIANGNLEGGASPVAPGTGILNTTANNGATGITSSENLVLGLFGYVDPPQGGSVTSYNGNTTSSTTTANPPTHDVLSLNPLRPAKYSYLDFVPGELSGGSAGLLEALTTTSKIKVMDTNVPEFIDRFPSPMPILYLRAFVGGTGVPQALDSDLDASRNVVQYNYGELSAYGCNVATSDGGGKWVMLDNNYFTNLGSLQLSGSASPYVDWNGMKTGSTGGFDGYLTNPNIGGGASQSTTGGAVRGKDGFILLSAGKDRTYGTHDDQIVTP